MTKKKKKDRLNIVYSTNPDFEYEYDAAEELETLPPNQQNLKVLLDKKQRKGKMVTLITGFVGTTNDLKELGKNLKFKCAAGGSVKNGEIIIQGDFREKVIQILSSYDYKVKKSGCTN